MNVVNSGSEYIIYGDDLKTYPKLPAGSYSLEFNKMRGFYLESFPDVSIDEKIYGVHEAKLNKVFNTFDNFSRSLGIILSGDKGIGKSLFAKMIAAESVKRELPVIIVNRYIPGIADFISSVDQECVILFDEFDKTFKICDGNNPQDEMLTLFDGVISGKKMYIITCNKLNNLNDYLVNRPGRFHYHFRFNYPTPDEIRDYMKDKIESKFWGEIENVVMFSKRTLINFDCLRAISFEINSGSTFAEAIKDLNIVNTEPRHFDATLRFANGKLIKTSVSEDNLFDSSVSELRIEFKDWSNQYCLAIIDKNEIYLNDDGLLTVSGDATRLDWSDEGYEDDEEVVKKLSEDSGRMLLDIKFKIRGQNAPIHYTV